MEQAWKVVGMGEDDMSSLLDEFYGLGVYALQGFEGNHAECALCAAMVRIVFPAFVFVLASCNVARADDVAHIRSRQGSMNKRSATIWLSFGCKTP
jgi:hypothetical protein